MTRKVSLKNESSYCVLIDKSLAHERISNSYKAGAKHCFPKSLALALAAATMCSLPLTAFAGDFDGDGIPDSVENDVAAGNAYTVNGSSNNSTGTITASNGATAVFSTTAIDIGGHGSVSFNADTVGVELVHGNGGTSVSDRFVHDISIVPDAGFSIANVIIRQAPFATSGNNEPADLTLTWSGGSTATIVDPDNQITSHADGDVINIWRCFRICRFGL